MALRQIMLKAKIDKKRADLKALLEKDADFSTREAELETAISEANTEEEQQVVNEQVEAYEKERETHETSKTELQKEIEGLERELEEAEKAPQESRSRKPGKKEERMENEMKYHEIRSLPMNVRAFDSLSMEMRQRILEREDVKNFLTRVRELKGVKRAVSGAELEIPVVFLELISENMYRYSKLLNRVRVRPVEGEARQTIAGTVPEAVWTEMCGEINELSFGFNQITLDGYKVAGYVPVCNSILEDTVSNLELASWILEMISESIAYAADKAILYGKGSNSKMPTGIVTRLAQTAQPQGYPASAPKWEDLHESNIIKINGDSMTPVEFFAAFAIAAGNTHTRYARGRKFWAMNSKTYAKIQSKLITFTATVEMVARLAGVMPITDGDVDILEFIPDDDIIGGYGELYLWVDRSAMTLDVSQHVQFIQDNTVFRGKQRADGAPVIAKSFVAINIANKNVTTVMDFAADVANDADLESLTIGTNTLNPVFNPKTTTYTIGTANADTAAVEAITAQPEATVEIAYNEKKVKNGGSVSLLKDSTAHPLTVTVKKGNAVKVYTVNITRASGG